ncbi:MAG: sugar phosphate isomerase/epimerase family protein [Planctomycetota bacterium]
MATTNTMTRRRFLGRTFKGGVAGFVGSSLMGRPVHAGQQEPADSAWRIGCYTRPWDRHHWRVALDAIAEAGFKHAGLMSTTVEQRGLVISVKTTPEEARRIGEEARKRGLEIPSVYGGGIPVGRSLEAGIGGLRKLIDNCVAAGARSLLMGGMGNKKLYDVYYKAIAECCDYAAEQGLSITIKPHGGLNASGAACRRCIERVGHENFSLWYDPGNVYHYSDGQLDPVDDAADVDGLVTEGMCIKDFQTSMDGGEVAKSVWVTPGTGMVDFPAVLARLKRGGFTGGDLVVETVTRDDPNDLNALLKEARKARRYLETLVES